MPKLLEFRHVLFRSQTANLTQITNGFDRAIPVRGLGMKITDHGDHMRSDRERASIPFGAMQESMHVGEVGPLPCFRRSEERRVGKGCTCRVSRSRAENGIRDA